MDFTFLKKDQIWGDSALDVIKKYGTKVAPTDLAVVLGSWMTDNPNDRTTENDLACYAWSASSMFEKVYTICDDGRACGYSADIRTIAARPALPPTETSKIKPNNVKIINGIRFGEYWESAQTVADVHTRERLEKLYTSNSLPLSGKNYTFDSVDSRDYRTPFKATTYPEYELDGERYIRVLARPADNDSILSTGERVEKGKFYWLKTEPIEWLIDKSGWWVSKKCLFAGIQFNTHEKCNGDFSKKAIKHYLDTYFSKEIEPAEHTVIRETSKSLEEPTARQKKYGITVSDEPMPVKDQINFYIQNGMSFMLHGPSGVGKTQRVKEIDPDLTSITLCNGILPEDVIGKTIYPNGVAENGGVWIPPAWYVDLCKKCQNTPDKQHVLFIDEVTNARETTQSLIYHIALNKSIAQGVGKLPDNAVVVLAGNSKEESGAAYNMPAPLFRRLSHIYLNLNIQDWLEWGSEQSKSHPEEKGRLNIHPLIASFVATYADKVFYTEYDEDNPATFALDPRKWEKVSDKIYANKGVMRREILEADVGPEIAISLMNYAQNPPLSLEEIMEGAYTENDIPSATDAKLALALSLRYATPKQVGIVRQFIAKNLGKENLAVFDSAWVGKDDMKALMLAKVQASAGR